MDWSGDDRPRRALLALLACGALFAGAAGDAQAARSCAPPDDGAEWTRAAPEEVDLDAGALQDALDYAAAEGSATAAVYRHGCLAGTDSHATTSRDKTYESWSAAKSVVSLAAGRAMTLGLLSPDDRVGSLVTEADRAHGAVTVRQLLTMTSGLHWNFFRDYSLQATMNRVNDALTLPFDHEPGTYFEYEQSAVALTAEVVARATGTDFQKFVQKELFTPLGIQTGSWSWKRDNAGHTLGFMGLQLRPRDYARLGQLMLQRGVWRGRRLLSRAYVSAATTPSATNPGYGWFWWVNAGTRFVAPTIQSRGEFASRFVASAPPDMFSAVGFGDQLVMVIPSLDLVITRSDARNPARRGEGADPTGRADFKYELVRRVMRAVKDRPMPDPGPYRPPTSTAAPDPNHGIRHSATERDDLAAARTTPPLPPRGPAVARAVLIGGKALRDTSLTLRVGRDGRAKVTVACPRIGPGGCHGRVTLKIAGASRQASYRARRGKRTSVRIAVPRSGRSGVMRASNQAKAGGTTAKTKVRIVRSAASWS